MGEVGSGGSPEVLEVITEAITKKVIVNSIERIVVIMACSLRRRDVCL